MFGIGFTEVLVILLVALLVLGPDKLPDLAKQIGKGLRELRRASSDLQNSLQEAMYADDVGEAHRNRPVVRPPALDQTKQTQLQTALNAMTPVGQSLAPGAGTAPAAGAGVATAGDTGLVSGAPFVAAAGSTGPVPLARPEMPGGGQPAAADLAATADRPAPTDVAGTPSPSEASSTSAPDRQTPGAAPGGGGGAA